MAFSHCVGKNLKASELPVGAVELAAQTTDICLNTVAGRTYQPGGWPNFAGQEGPVLCLFGTITADGVQRAVAILDEAPIRVVWMAVAGGDARAAIALAHRMLDKSVDVVVHRYCFSACANYLFMGGRRKIIMEGSMIAWHGAPLKNPGLPQHLFQIGVEHLEFYKRVGVHPELTSKPPLDLYYHDPEFQHLILSGQKPFWTYRFETLRRRFNVQGIEYVWQPQSTEELAKAGFREEYRTFLSME